MTRTEIRLECLKLCYRRDHTSEQVITFAKELENYVGDGPNELPVEKAEAPVKRGNVSSKKATGNLDILS